MTDKKNWLIWQILLWMLLIPGVLFASGKIQITSIRFVKIDAATRTIITLNQSTPARIFSLAHPDRLVIDFSETKLAANIRNLKFQTSDIKALRVGHPDAHTLRLVFDMNQLSHYKIVSRPEDSALVIDLPFQMMKPEKSAKIPEKKSIPTATSKKVADPKPHTIVVVIDPGHGGKDPGAVGERGTKEKNVVLAIAKNLAEQINRQPNMQAVLTRSGDYFVPLRNRLRLARKGNADLFVAIHADSFFSDNTTGASVYALSQHGATTEAARWLARRDNYSELGGVNLRELGDQSYLLRSVLIDLAQTATTTDSLHLGSTVLHALHDVTDLHFPKVEQAPFVVLKSPDIPSVLVETGFISSTDEELRLRDPAYQQKIASALFAGIQNYLKKYSAVGV